MTNRRYFSAAIAVGVAVFITFPSGVIAQAKPTAPANPAPLTPVKAPIDVAPQLSDDELFQLEQKYKDAMAVKRFDDALLILQQLPEATFSRPRKAEKQWLMMFQSVENKVASSSSLFQKDDELDDETRKNIQKLYRQAQSALIENQPELAKDMLIHVLFLHRQNLRAKALLDDALDLKSGAYKIENMEAKYWNKSSIAFYGGNYQQAVDVLNALSYFDKDNPVVFERLGSAYYMMGEKEKAVSAWNTVLFLDPSNKEIDGIIKKTQQLIADEKAEVKAQRTKPRTTKAVNVADTQLMGKFAKQEQAYDYANTLRKQGVEAIVAEDDDGKWSVRVPKKGGK